MDEIVLLESASLRAKLCTNSNVCILDRVGQLVTLSETGWATTENVAAFFQVQIKTLRKIVERHKEEFLADGYKVMSKSEFEKRHHVVFEIPNRGLAIFPRRAVLRSAMLLRDSVIAKMVRTYLLDNEQASLTSVDKKALTKMADQLSHQAQILVEHSTQIHRNIDQITKSAIQVKSQADIIKAVVHEIYQNRERIDGLENKYQYHDQRIAALENFRYIKELRTDYITSEQIELLKNKVKEKGKPITIWKRFNKAFGIPRYKFLPSSRFQEAMHWLDSYGVI